MWKDNADVIVEGQGEVVVDFDYAVLIATIEGRGNNGKEAKENAKDKIKTLQDTVEHFKTKDLIDQLISFFNVKPNRVYRHGETVQEGYRATYTLRFTTRKLDMVNEMHDALTECADSVESPAFRLDNPQKYEEEALKKAWERVRNGYKQQCDIFGVKGETKICGWNVGREEVSLGKGGHEEGPVTIIAGKAHINVTLRAGFCFAGARYLQTDL